jgi:hypothetical protein
MDEQVVFQQAKGPSGSDESAPQKKAVLGLLLVHGIGTQTEGVTLLEGGGPLLNWLRDWLHLDPRISRGVLKPSENKGENRAQFEFSLPVDPQSPASTQRILVTECLWARQFDPPPFRKLCGWLLSFGAWIALRQSCAGVAGWFRSVFQLIIPVSVRRAFPPGEYERILVGRS